MAAATLIFSSLGHLYFHLFTAFYFTIVIALGGVWEIPYERLLSLWTIPALILGLAALPAGLLGDRFGAEKMMVIFFIGTGASAIAAGFTDSTDALVICLIGIGLFGAIYHPVGVPWLVRNSGDRKGKALGIHGIFGTLGTAAAAKVSGALIDTFNWRLAFIVPGIFCLATGLALVVSVARRRQTVACAGWDKPMDKPNHDGIRRTFIVLLVTMFVAAFIYHCTLIVLPKMFALRLDFVTNEHGTVKLSKIGDMVAIVYIVAAFMQLLGGYLADRYSLKLIYTLGLVMQVPLLWLIGLIDGPILVVLTTLAVMFSVGILPAENILLSRTAPPNRQGLAFGIKFVLAFVAAPVAVQTVAMFSDSYGFDWLFVVMAGCALGAFAVACLLPRIRWAVATS